MSFRIKLNQQAQTDESIKSALQQVDKLKADHHQVISTAIAFGIGIETVKMKEKNQVNLEFVSEFMELTEKFTKFTTFFKNISPTTKSIFSPSDNNQRKQAIYETALGNTWFAKIIAPIYLDGVEKEDIRKHKVIKGLPTGREVPTIEELKINNFVKNLDRLIQKIPYFLESKNYIKQSDYSKIQDELKANGLMNPSSKEFMQGLENVRNDFADFVKSEKAKALFEIVNQIRATNAR